MGIANDDHFNSSSFILLLELVCIYRGSGGQFIDEGKRCIDPCLDPKECSVECRREQGTPPLLTIRVVLHM